MGVVMRRAGGPMEAMSPPSPHRHPRPLPPSPCAGHLKSEPSRTASGVRKLPADALGAESSLCGVARRQVGQRTCTDGLASC